MRSETGPVRCGCGGEAIVETVTTHFEQKSRFRIRCRKCNISTIWDYFSEAEAVEAWNKAMSGHLRWSSLADVRPEGVYCKGCGYRMDCDE